MNERLGLMEDQQRLRESATRNLTPAARHQAFPALFAKPIPSANILAEADAKIKRLTAQVAVLRSTVRTLEAEKRNLADRLALALLARSAASLAGEPLFRAATIAEVQSIFCKAFNDLGGSVDGRAYTVGDLTSPSRRREMAWPRMACMSAAKIICGGKSLPMIGRAFGNRDHTTVMHALKAVPLHMEEMPMLKVAHGAVIEHFRVR